MLSRVEHVSRFSAALPFPTSSATLKACTWGTSRTKKGLSSEHWRITQNGLLVRLPFQFHFLHLFICHRHGVRRPPRFAPIEFVFRLAEIGRAENAAEFLNVPAEIGGQLAAHFVHRGDSGNSKSELTGCELTGYLLLGPTTVTHILRQSDQDVK